MSEALLKAAWAALALLHAAPAAVAFAPGLAARLYGVDPTGPLAVLLAHRGVLFLAVLALAAFAAFDPGARRAASVVVAISMIGFLALYAQAGAPAGPLRGIAIADAVGLLPLALVALAAWRGA